LAFGINFICFSCYLIHIIPIQSAPPERHHLGVVQSLQFECILRFGFYILGLTLPLIYSLAVSRKITQQLSTRCQITRFCLCNQFFDNWTNSLCLYLSCFDFLVNNNAGGKIAKNGLASRLTSS